MVDRGAEVEPAAATEDHLLVAGVERPGEQALHRGQRALGHGGTLLEAVLEAVHRLEQGAVPGDRAGVRRHAPGAAGRGREIGPGAVAHGGIPRQLDTGHAAQQRREDAREQARDAARHLGDAHLAQRPGCATLHRFVLRRHQKMK